MTEDKKFANKPEYIRINPISKGIPSDSKLSVTENAVNTNPKIAMGYNIFLEISKSDFILKSFVKYKKIPPENSGRI